MAGVCTEASNTVTYKPHYISVGAGPAGPVLAG